VRVGKQWFSRMGWEKTNAVLVIATGRKSREAQ